MNPAAPSPPAVDRLLSVEQVAGRFGVAAKTVRAWVHRGLLPALRVAPTAPLRIREKDAQRFIDERIRGGTK